MVKGVDLGSVNPWVVEVPPSWLQSRNERKPKGMYLAYNPYSLAVLKDGGAHVTRHGCGLRSRAWPIAANEGPRAASLRT